MEQLPSWARSHERRKSPDDAKSVRNGAAELNAETRAVILKAREFARHIAMALPLGFDRVMPRGYTLSGGTLVMTKIQNQAGRTAMLHGTHCQWGVPESESFLKDLGDGWLVELAAFMRWQLREDADQNTEFQHTLRDLRNEWAEAAG